MKTMIIALLIGGTNANEGETFPLDPEQVYVKEATWSETMLATRANCAEWAKTATEHKLRGTSSVAVWRKIAKDWPEQFGTETEKRKEHDGKTKRKGHAFSYCDEHRIVLCWSTDTG